MAGERRLVTILFACVPGLPMLLERLNPEAAYRLINACVEALSASVHRYGGTVDKFIGQELMAVFGAPEVHEDDAARALWAALEMIESLERFNQAHREYLPEPLTIRCGVNTGMVFAGQVGSLGLRAFTVIGDAVNLASRLAHLAEAEQVFVGEVTYQQTRRLFRYRPLPPLSVRGRLEMVPAYILLGARGGYGRAWGARLLFSPLVGRVRELTTLRNHLYRLMSGQGGAVSIIGEAGLGKSRLVAELRSVVREPCWLEGRSLAFQNEEPYFPFRGLLQRHLGLDEQTLPAQACLRLRELVAGILSESGEEAYPYLSYLLGLSPEEQSSTALDLVSGEGLRLGLFRAFRALLRGLAQSRPTVVVMEDLHWADESSLALLTYLMPLVSEVPLLFLLVVRAEPRGGALQTVRESAAHTGVYDEILLSPLSWEESATLVTNLLQGDRLPTALQQRVLEKAEGNPLFVEEIIRALILERVLVQREEHWEVTRSVASIHIPDTLWGLLVSRVDQLEPQVRETLRRAAVIGRVFPESVLAAVSDEPQALAQHLALLLDYQFIRYYRLEEDLGRAFIFNHPLTHEAAYESILWDERRQLHRRTLEAMESLYADRLEAHTVTLARHAYLGQVWEKAAHYLHLAGDQAKSAYALPEAVRNYQRAMGVIQEYGVAVDRERLADLYHECCSAQVQLGYYDAARAVCNALMEMGERLHDPYLRGHALRGAALIAAYTGDTVAQIASARAACAELKTAEADWSRGTALFILALGLFKAGQLDEASAAIEEGLCLVGESRRWPGHDPRGEALYYAGMIALLKGRAAEAIDLLGQGEERARQTGEQTVVGFCVGFASLAHASRGEYSLALEKAQAGMRVGQAAELPVVVYASSACAAWVQTMIGRYGAAIQQAAPVSREEVVSRDTQAIATVALGDAYLGLLDYERALTHHQKALEVAGLTHVATAPAMRGIGLAYVLLGQKEQGLASLNNSLLATGSFGLEYFRAEVLRDLSRAYLASGDFARALNAAEQVVALAESAEYRGLFGWGVLLRGLASASEADIRYALEVGRRLDCLALQWEAGEALARLAGDREALRLAQSAVRVIADELSEDLRAGFLSRPRVRTLLSGEGWPG